MKGGKRRSRFVFGEYSAGGDQATEERSGDGGLAIRAAKMAEKRQEGTPPAVIQKHC